MAGDVLVGEGFMTLENVDDNEVIWITLDIDSAAMVEVDIIELSTTWTLMVSYSSVVDFTTVEYSDCDDMAKGSDESGLRVECWSTIEIVGDVIIGLLGMDVKS